MTNTYRAITDTGVAMYQEGVFELDLSPADEQDVLAAGHIELVPRKYKVLSDNFEAGGQGSMLEAAYPVEIEQALVSGGHIERVDEPEADEKPTAKKKADSKES